MSNFVILGGDDNDFIGSRSVLFSQDGDYGMAFDYVGDDANYMLRLGIGTINNDLSASIGSISRFSIQDLMWEELNSEDNSPSEYVSPMNRWCFGYD